MQTEMNTDMFAQAVGRAGDTAEIVIRAGAVDDVAGVFARAFPGRAAVVIADDNTFDAAGKRVYQGLQAAVSPGASTAGSVPAVLSPYVFPGTPMLHPRLEHVESMAALLRETGAVGIAVGSGTVNDIVKLASHQAGERYMSVATAASVDGYASFGAAILSHGYKTTVSCPAPLIVVADVDVLSRAPYEMTASGYADLVGKITAGADWLIAAALGLEPVDRDVWDMVQPPLRSWVSDPVGLRQGDASAFSGLFEGLTASALAMQVLRDTRPASGTEHLFSHVWEMQNLEMQGKPVSHGFKVGIGTLAATALMETMFSREISGRDIENAVSRRISATALEAAVRSTFGPAPYTDSVVEASLKKHDDDDAFLRRMELAGSVWPTLKDQVRKQIMPFQEIRTLLIEAGCPVTPEEIGLTRERLIRTYAAAQMIRPRYTALDLAFELGLLQECVDSIFESHRYF